MLIYRVHQDKKKLCQIIPSIDNIHLIKFDGVDRKGNEDVEVNKYSYEKLDNLEELGDFLFLNAGVIVISEKLKNTDLWWCLKYSGEMLPIFIKDVKTKYYIANITNCPNIIDYKNSQLGEKDEYDESEVIKLAIKIERFDYRRTIFKLFDDASLQIYTVNKADLGLDFKVLVESLNLDFFSFEPLLEYEYDYTNQSNILKEDFQL